MTSCRSRAGTLLAAVAAVVALVAADIAVASPADATSTAERHATFEAATSEGSGTISTAQDTGDGFACLDDAGGDTRDLETGEPTDEPRADIVEHCVSFGTLLGLHIEVATPTDPLTDGNWRVGTFAAWSLDTTGDGDGEFFVDFSLRPDGGAIEARVSDLRGDEAALTCTVPGTFDGSLYRVGGIDADACLGGAAEVSVQAGMFYDAPDDDTGDDRTVHYDTAPDDAGFTEGVEQNDDVACPVLTPAPFDDRDQIAPAHVDSVDCGYEHGLVLGRAVGDQLLFDPGADVNRGQFSAFVRRSILVVGADDPPRREERFDDVSEGNTFDADIHHLAGGEIVRGFSGNVFRPGEPVDRGQTASFLVQAFEWSTGTELTAQQPGQHFSDIADNVHEGNIDAGFENNLVRGTTAPSNGERGTYSPLANTARQQMASVLINFVTELE